MKALTFLLCFILPLGTIAVPLKRLAHLGTRNAAHAAAEEISARDFPEIQARQNPIIAGIVGEVISNIIEGVVDVIQSLSQEDDREIAFINTLLGGLTQTYPDYNVLIYHDDPGKPNSERIYYENDGNTWVCEHYELKHKFNTKGYEICFVRSGELVRGKGQEGGFRNWGWRDPGHGGCVSRPNLVTLEFCII
ncbi:hypothetical protein QBC39DRAFT_99418 [Podospora conica]|nr:hypothetical protein QBC39DRAFT_99418 [Schizothecium conicum]